ncbi:MAG: hypothetical protein M3O50_06650, partial [Myxococcota bacterium]|nr:hypothetical protein [Myxococcota bacterium]
MNETETERSTIALQVGAARRGVLAVRGGDSATLLISGKDRIAWLNGLLTCDLANLSPGHARYGLAVARNGRVLADATIVSDAPSARVFAAVPAATAAVLRAHLDHYLVMEDVEIEEPSGGFETWTLHGPRSAEALEGARAAGATGGIVDRT